MTGLVRGDVTNKIKKKTRGPGLGKAGGAAMKVCEVHRNRAASGQPMDFDFEKAEKKDRRREPFPTPGPTSGSGEVEFASPKNILSRVNG